MVSATNFVFKCPNTVVQIWETTLTLDLTTAFSAVLMFLITKVLPVFVIL